MISSLWSAAGAHRRRSAGPSLSAACAALLLALAQQGCASLASERSLFLEGWHPGRVIKVASGAALGPLFRSDCRRDLPADAAARSQYAIVRYSVSTSRYAERVIPMASAEAVQPGDRVYVNTKECRPPMKVAAAPQPSDIS